MRKSQTIVVFGATGQQGGSVVAALRSDGWQLRAVVRDPSTPASRALAANGVVTVQGDFADPASLQAAMSGAYGVFSVQPSSGQGAAYGVSDEDEIRYGRSVIDIAADCGVNFLVYASANAASSQKSGVGHFDTKAEIEAHLRQSPLAATVIRPSAFMEILLTPGLGLAEGKLSFFMRQDQAMQFIAIRDIGLIVARVFAEPSIYRGRTMEIAGDAVTGAELSEKFSRAANRIVEYQRFSDQDLEATPFLGSLARLVDDGRLAGRADIEALARSFPGLMRMDDWLDGPGQPAFQNALRATGELAPR